MKFKQFILKTQKKFTNSLFIVKNYIGSDSIYKKGEIDVGKLIKTYTTYSIILSILVSIFSYKFTKAYYECFNYEYFQKQDTFDIYWFTFTRLELIEKLLDPILLFVLLIFGGMASYGFISKVNSKESKKTSTTEKWSVLDILGYFSTIGFVTIPYIFVAYSIGSYDSALKTFIFMFFILILCMAKKEYLHSAWSEILNPLFYGCLG